MVLGLQARRGGAVEHYGGNRPPWAVYRHADEQPQLLGWAETTIYAWGNDITELFGSWPGILPTGSVEIKGVTSNYYDTGEANKGLTYNLIMNNNCLLYTSRCV